MRFFWLVFLALASAGCKLTDPSPVVIDVNPHVHSGMPKELRQLVTVETLRGAKNLPDTSVLFALTTEQQAHFLNYYTDPSRADIAKHKRLYNYIDNLYVGFTYLGDTYDAQTAFATQSGNCLSLAILTTALADLAGLEVAYQEVNAAPVYRRFDNVMTLSTHVRTHLFEELSPEELKTTVIRGKIIIDYYPERGNIRGNMIATDTFFAMYYRNLASDAIINGQLTLAYELLTNALQIAPSDAESLNAMAVVLNKMGYSQKALKLYRYAVSHGSESLNLLANYAVLARAMGFVEEAEQLNAALSKSDDSNPYRWLDLANERIHQGKHHIARSMLTKTLERAPYLHEAYFSLAKSYYLTGQQDAADESLRKAAELAQQPETEKLYEQKRAVLAIVDDEAIN
ncbi:tetratricopeptide repeat protein [Alteromonas flava]|uniref:tetratricopeptide repeat protein n=1 Tax=Alteromonas flava TaxID=2048003 RepID=UPI000C294FDB|nr:hypothetical protein [Alteromonas flava]